MDKYVFITTPPRHNIINQQAQAAIVNGGADAIGLCGQERGYDNNALSLLEPILTECVNHNVLPVFLANKFTKHGTTATQQARTKSYLIKKSSNRIWHADATLNGQIISNSEQHNRKWVSPNLFAIKHDPTYSLMEVAFMATPQRPGDRMRFCWGRHYLENGQDRIGGYVVDSPLLYPERSDQKVGTLFSFVVPTYECNDWYMFMQAYAREDGEESSIWLSSFRAREVDPSSQFILRPSEVESPGEPDYLELPGLREGWYGYQPIQNNQNREGIQMLNHDCLAVNTVEARMEFRTFAKLFDRYAQLSKALMIECDEPQTLGYGDFETEYNSAAQGYADYLNRAADVSQIFFPDKPLTIYWQRFGKHFRNVNPKNGGLENWWRHLKNPERFNLIVWGLTKQEDMEQACHDLVDFPIMAAVNAEYNNVDAWQQTFQKTGMKPRWCYFDWPDANMPDPYTPELMERFKAL